MKSDINQFLIFSITKYVDIIFYEYFEETDEIYILTKNDGELFIKQSDYNDYVTYLKDKVFI